MESLLNAITVEMMENRREKMKKYIQQEHNQILKKIHEQASYVLRIKKTKYNAQLYNQVSQSFLLFQTSCENIMNIYFPLLMDTNYLSLQCQQQLIDKITGLKTIIQRNAQSLTKKLTKNKDEPQKQKKIKKLKKKGKNCKIPLQSTSIMQKWLLVNFKDPYPSQSKKIEMARSSKLTVSQVNNWFINARQRVIKKFLKKDPKWYQKSYRQSIESNSQSD